jgi:hypothetical protein
MTDAYLLQRFLSEYPWIQEMYKKTSGYIPFVRRNIFSTLSELLVRTKRAIEAYIGPDDWMVSSEIYSEAIETMILITHSLLTYMADWVQKDRSIAQSHDAT